VLKIKINIKDISTLRGYFYNKLLKSLKDKLTKVLKLKTLLEQVKIAIAINSKAYKRH